jgi:hypothetical protein|tara:strand:- start:190 stop:750 length:561 start_codon:yes stop_codon:yes gene_type:complete
MKLLLENWRKFLTEEQGEWIGTIDDLGSDLYRITKRYTDYGDNLEMFKKGTGIVKSSDRSADDDEPYLNSDGEPEHRIYFFRSQNEATAAMMSDIEEVEAIVGDFSEEDRDRGINENLLLVRVRMNLLPPEVEFFTDPELEGTPYDTIYGAYPDGRKWELSPRAGDVQVASELLNDEEDDYYYEGF